MANERRLIDADKILKFCEDGLNNKAFGHDAIEIMAEIQCAPTVDAVEVVCCKDCKWFAPNNHGEWYGCQMFNAIRIVPEDAPSADDFCSYGERRGEGWRNSSKSEMKQYFRSMRRKLSGTARSTVCLFLKMKLCSGQVCISALSTSMPPL